MKVLSIKEPFATLILTEKKHIETRSWKTNYRGELFIHASIQELKNRTKELQSLIANNNLNCGKIICSCNLVDCIYMSEDYIKKIKDNNYQEYLCGEYKIGRYAWVLEDVKPLDKKIPAKGNLGIWNYYNEFDVLNLMTNIKYGWMDCNNNLHTDFDKFKDNYVLQTPKEVIKNNIGVCWDQVELERYYLKNNKLDIKTFFLVNYNDSECKTHTFLTYNKAGKYYWFENSWEKFKGIHKYNTLDDLLWDVRDKFIKNELSENIDIEKIVIREYNKPKSHINVLEFFKHCEKGKIYNLRKD